MLEFPTSYREVSMLANARYLNALAVVDDPTQAKRDLDRLTTRKTDAAGRSCARFNPIARHDSIPTMKSGF